MEERILSFDQSTKKTGWAFINKGKVEAFGLIESKDKNVFMRINEMFEQIKELVEKYLPDEILMEDTFEHDVGSVDTLKKLSMLQGAIVMLCFQLKIPFLFLYPKEWRAKFSLNVKGRENQKAAAIQYVQNVLHVDVNGKDDIAEAILLGLSLKR